MMTGLKVIQIGITENLNDPNFSNGQFADSINLGDRGAGSTVAGQFPPFVPDWDASYYNRLDGVILYTAEIRETLQEKIKEIDDILHDSYCLVTSLCANVRPEDQRGHEQ
jgi:hypothetical protein